MNAQFKSQILGLSLATATAIGCLAYERITKAFSFPTVAILGSAAYLPFALFGLYSDNGVKNDLTKFGEHRWAIAVYLASGMTVPLWYVITRKQNVMAGSIYEVKYIVILAVFYVFFGARPMTFNTAVGVCFALTSIWFISKG